MNAQLGRRGFVVAAAASATLAATATGSLWATPARAATTEDAAGVGPVFDVVRLGDDVSEQAHGLTAELSAIVVGALSQSARVFHPTEPASWWGGSCTVTLAVDPEKTNYVSAKFWGGDHAPDLDQAWRMQYFVDGEQLGYFDQSFIDSADIMEKDPRSPGRFFFHTLPLPESLTAGKTSVQVRLRSEGRIYPYGQSSAAYFRNQTADSRGVYRIYTHTEPHFEPTADDVVGSAPAAPLRSLDDEASAVAAVRDRVLADQGRYFAGFGHDARDGMSVESLAYGYDWADSPAYRNEATLARMCSVIDAYYRDWKAKPTVLTSQWQGFGRLAQSLTLHWSKPRLQAELDAPVSTGNTIINNPGFEVGTTTATGWQWLGWSAPAKVSRDATVAHSGTASLRFDTVAKVAIVGPQVETLCGEGTFAASIWAKATGANVVQLNSLFYNAAGTLVGGDHKADIPSTTSTEWQKIEQTFAVPAGAVKLQLRLQAGGEGGTVWFDDIEATIPPPPASTYPTRRVAYREMFVESRDYWSQNARPYTNQAMILNMGVYQANRILKQLSPGDAWPETEAIRWMREAAGLDPWLGARRPDGTRTRTYGSSYYTVSPAGLTRELGFVGSYGEISNWVTDMLNAIEEGEGAVPDPEFREHVIRMTKVRTYFRRYDVDKDGKKISRLASAIGWRIEKNPADIAYVQRTTVESNPLQAASTLGDRDLEAWAQRMIDEGQLAPQLTELVTNTSNAAALTALHFISHDYPVFKAITTPARPMPTEWDQPDFLVSDEVNGAFALKSGQELFFASTYWRARQGVNGYARVHFVRPDGERSGIVRERVDGLPENPEYFTVPDWTTWDWALSDPMASVPPGGFPAPVSETLTQVFAGQRHPVMPLPAGFAPDAFSGQFGEEKPLVGRAPYYSFEYAHYSVGQNTTTDRTFSLTNPFPVSTVVISNDDQHDSVKQPGEVLEVGPQKTVVLRRMSGGVACSAKVTTKKTGRTTALVVSVTNTSTVPADISAKTAYGSFSFAKLAPGRTATHAFTTRLAVVPTGEVTTTTVGTLDGRTVSAVSTWPYGA